jgi:hypothetical protein
VDTAPPQKALEVRASKSKEICMRIARQNPVWAWAKTLRPTPLSMFLRQGAR